MNRTQEEPSEDTEVSSQHNKLQKTYYYPINPVTSEQPPDRQRCETLGTSNGIWDHRDIIQL